MQRRVVAELIARRAKFLIDTLFPLFCLGCDKEGSWLCLNCRSKLRAAGIFCCPLCHRARVEGRCCDNCASSSYVDRHMALDKYDEGSLLGRIIEVFKYQYLLGIVCELRPLIQKFFYRYALLMPSGRAVVAPVPLHKRREAERGFNQASVIARIVADTLRLSFADDLLSRTRFTLQQAKLSRKERIKNVRGAFQIASDKSVRTASDKSVSDGNVTVASRIAGGTIILVDDVYTTGSTMQECARVLKESGAIEVVGFTLARG